MNNEQKQELVEKVSNTLNNTGAYNEIVDIIQKATGLSVDNDSHVFSEIEEIIVDLIIEDSEQH